MKNWTNTDNATFYNNLPLQEFYAITRRCGLENCCDLELAQEYIDNADSILDVGAGYGRVLDYIIDRGHKCNLYGLERNTSLVKILKSKFKNKVEIFDCDLRHFKTDFRFDLILWMWSSISEFSATEQLSVLKKLTLSLIKKGHLIIDIIPAERKPKRTTELDSQNFIFETPYGQDYGYFPKSAEIFTYAEKLNLSIEKIINYKTENGRERTIYILHKLN